MLDDEILKSPFVTVLDEQKQRIWTLFRINILENIGMSYFTQQINLLEEGVCGNHRRVYGYLFDSKLSVFVTFSSLIIPEINFGHGSFSEHIGVVDLVFVEDKKLSFIHITYIISINKT